MTSKLLLAVLATFTLATPAIAQSTAGWREPDPENVLVIETNKGRIVAELTPFAAPLTVERIKTLTRAKFYDGLTFFRVIDEFMAQTGDPENKGSGDSDLPNLPPEFTFKRGRDLPVTRIGVAQTGFIGPIAVSAQPDALMAMTVDGRASATPLFCQGSLGMARAKAPDTGNSQFFLMRQAGPQVFGQYSVFGRVISGLDVVRAIKTGEPVPDPQDRMTSVRLLSDIPAPQRPRVLVRETKGPEFLAQVEAVRAAKGATFNACDLDIEAVVQ